MIYNYPYHRNYYNRYNNFPTNNFKTNYNEREFKNLEVESHKLDLEKSDEDSIIDILGIKLYFDDLLIIGLLYLLYDQDVKDFNLYIVLILLLLN